MTWHLESLSYLSRKFNAALINVCNNSVENHTTLFSRLKHNQGYAAQ